MQGAEERGEAGEHIEEDLKKKCEVCSRRFCALGSDCDVNEANDRLSVPKYKPLEVPPSTSRVRVVPSSGFGFISGKNFMIIF